MKLVLLAGCVSASLLVVSCKSRELGGSSAPSSTTTGTALKPPPFNAFQLWESGGQGVSFTQYPPSYEVLQGATEADGFFFVSKEGYFADVEAVPGSARFTGTPTAGASVNAAGDTLTYPADANQGRTQELRLTFSEPSGELMSQVEAAKHCTGKLRLPTARELFDFCAAGTTPNAQGQFSASRCAQGWLWSASVSSAVRGFAWAFTGELGTVSILDRSERRAVRCVGSAG